MTLRIGTSDGSYTYPSARSRDEDEQPRLLFREPRGREVTELRQLQADREDAEREWLEAERDKAVERRRQYADDPQEVDPDEWMRWRVPRTALEEAADKMGAVVLDWIAEDEDEELTEDDLEEHLEDGEYLITAQVLRRRLVMLDWTPPRRLVDRYLEWCVGMTIGVEQITYGAQDVPIRWDDDGVMVEAFGAQLTDDEGAHEARKLLIDAFGELPWERQKAPFRYAAAIEERAGLTPEQKKD